MERRARAPTHPIGPLLCLHKAMVRAGPAVGAVQLTGFRHGVYHEQHRASTC